jgi:DNA gyrase/topoisomerase IV subunit A
MASINNDNSSIGHVQKKLLNVIIKESDEIVAKYGRPRRTHIADSSVADVLPTEAFVLDQKEIIVFSEAGHIKRICDSSFMSQVRIASNLEGGVDVCK